MKNRATSYSDFFKGKTLTPGDPEDSNGKITKPAVATKPKSRTVKEDERSAAIKRRLKLTAGKAITKASRRS